MSSNVNVTIKWCAALIFAAASVGAPAQADFVSAAYRLTVAEATQGDKALREFYEETGFEPLWTGRNREDRARRAAFVEMLGNTDLHGLPSDGYDIQDLERQLSSARSQSDLARIEIAFSKTFLEFARDIQTGVLKPDEVDEQIARKVPLRDRKSYLTSLSQSTPKAFFRSLAPSSAEYTRLAAEKMRLRKIIAQGGWGETVPSGELMGWGASGPRVIALRNRLIAMEYLEPNYSNVFDDALTSALWDFQEDHGLKADGIAGPSTVSMINVSAVERLKSVIVAMERERWTNMELGERHVLVNLADFHARIFDDGKVTFESRSVVGHPDEDRRSPEFSDKIEHMVVNPTWNVPRSIATKEYLPMLQEDNLALDYLNLFDPEGELVDRTGLDFTEFTEETFPFDMKQPPSNGNALGLVKFMFPNRHNIYLHDTPAKSLFAEEKRAFSHGCIRLGSPFEFAYALLALQTSDPYAVFHDVLETGVETVIPLDKHVPVHLIYRTAVGSAEDRMGYRRDVYGRDALIWQALENAGVELGV